MLLQRVTGIGTILLGAFALSFCVAFLDDLWNTPQRTVAIVVTVASALIIFIGVVIGFPEVLPRNVVALSIFLFGVLAMFAGVSILAWVIFNIFVARQPQFQMGNLSFPIISIYAGYTIATRSFFQLKHRNNSSHSDANN